MIVTNVATRPGNRPAKGALVIARLQADEDPNADAPGYVAGDRSIDDDCRTRADSTGAWSLDLVPNAEIIPAGTVYLVDEVVGRSTTRHIITVPATGGPYWLGDILSDPPGALPTAALGGHLADPTDAHAASATSFTPTGSIEADNVQEAIEEAILESGAVQSVNGRVGTVTGLQEAIPSGTYVETALVDAVGDLLVGTAPDTLARLPKGTALQALRVNAGATALEWAAPSAGSRLLGMAEFGEYIFSGAAGTVPVPGFRQSFEWDGLAQVRVALSVPRVNNGAAGDVEFSLVVAGATIATFQRKFAAAGFGEILGWNVYPSPLWVPAVGMNTVQVNWRPAYNGNTWTELLGYGSVKAPVLTMEALV